MVKVRIQVVAEIGTRNGQVVCGVVVESSYSEVIKVVQTKLKLKTMRAVTLYYEGESATRHILPRGDLSEVLQNDMKVFVTKDETFSSPTSAVVEPGRWNATKADARQDTGDLEIEEWRKCQCKRIVLIGVGGPSGVGKSTLAKNLAEALDSPITAVQLDWYNGVTSSPEGQLRKKTRNFETPDTIDFRSLQEDLHRIAASLANGTAQGMQIVRPRGNHDLERTTNAQRNNRILPPDVVVIIVEGFLLFHDRDLGAMCDVQIWLEAEFKECLDRRYERTSSQKRTYPEFSEWYRDHVWKHYLTYRAEQLNNAQAALQLSSRNSKDVVLTKAVAHIRASLLPRDCMATDDKDPDSMTEELHIEKASVSEVHSSENLSDARTTKDRRWKTKKK